MAERELHGPGNPFPFDITAYEAAQPVGHGYRFGVDKDRTIALIRELADRIENGDFLLQSVESQHKFSHEDYTLNSWIITVAQKVKVSQ